MMKREINLAHQIRAKSQNKKRKAEKRSLTGAIKRSRAEKGSPERGATRKSARNGRGSKAWLGLKGITNRGVRLLND